MISITSRTKGWTFVRMEMWNQLIRLQTPSLSSLNICKSGWSHFVALRCIIDPHTLPPGSIWALLPSSSVNQKLVLFLVHQSLKPLDLTPRSEHFVSVLVAFILQSLNKFSAYLYVILRFVSILVVELSFKGIDLLGLLCYPFLCSKHVVFIIFLKFFIELFQLT